MTRLRHALVALLLIPLWLAGVGVHLGSSGAVSAATTPETAAFHVYDVAARSYIRTLASSTVDMVQDRLAARRAGEARGRIARVLAAEELAATSDELTAAAGRAVDTIGPGRGPVYGTRVHAEFEGEVAALGRSDLSTEVSYLNGRVVPRGTPGSVRPDVVEGSLQSPTAIYDLKTGSASLSASRIAQTRSQLPPGFQNIPNRQAAIGGFKGTGSPDEYPGGGSIDLTPGGGAGGCGIGLDLWGTEQTCTRDPVRPA